MLNAKLLNFCYFFFLLASFEIIWDARFATLYWILQRYIMSTFVSFFLSHEITMTSGQKVDFDVAQIYETQQKKKTFLVANTKKVTMESHSFFSFFTFPHNKYSNFMFLTHCQHFFFFSFARSDLLLVAKCDNDDLVTN